MNDNPALRQSPQADTAPRTAETLLPPVDVIEDGAGITLYADLPGVPKDKLAIAMKGASEGIKDLFFKNMSERAAKLLREDMEAMGPVRLKDVDEAQMAIVTIAKDLAAKGEIVIAGDSAEDQLVY